MYNLPKEVDMTLPLLAEYVNRFKRDVAGRYKPLQDFYLARPGAIAWEKKAEFKPDNRIIVDFPRYIVDTMCGYFVGNPIKVTSDDTAAADYVGYLNAYNDQHNVNAELVKNCGIFGKAYEMYYTDADANLCIAQMDPTEAFMIFDDSIIPRPLFFIRLYTDYKNMEHGSIADAQNVRHFDTMGEYRWTDDWVPHSFDGVPATEFTQNDERQGLFEPVLSMVKAYDKAVSEKANDVDYFADAYMKILGPELNSEDLHKIKENRIINLPGDGAEKVICEFMEKPDGDTTQENLVNRLERLIYQISGVANITDENFGAASGISLKYKLLAMSNIEKTMERRFSASMTRRYKILFSAPVAALKVGRDAWLNLDYTFTPNVPANVLEESEIAKNLEGIVPRETQLKVLSVVDNVQDAVKALDEEQAQVTLLPASFNAQTGGKAAE